MPHTSILNMLQTLTLCHTFSVPISKILLDPGSASSSRQHGRPAPPDHRTSPPFQPHTPEACLHLSLGERSQPTPHVCNNLPPTHHPSHHMPPLPGSLVQVFVCSFNPFLKHADPQHTSGAGFMAELSAAVRVPRPSGPRSPWSSGPWSTEPEQNGQGDTLTPEHLRDPQQVTYPLCLQPSHL